MPPIVTSWRKPLIAAAIFCSSTAWAGPPFLTDDPEPVELHHWEFYGATQWAGSRHAASGTCPHVEVNYGALQGVQLHAIVPAVLAWTDADRVALGPGDIELGVKWRFIDEGKWRPQIGVFPLVTLPAGSKERGLGAGAVEGLAPLWIQKSFGPWTTYGGGGIKFTTEGDAVMFGWLLQRDLSETFTVGAEVFVTTPLNGDPTQIQVNLGAIINLSDRHHVLVSAGPAFRGEDSMQAYLAYQLTI